LLEDRLVPTVVFDPAGYGPATVQIAGTTVTRGNPVTSNPYALSNPSVYFIFEGKGWQLSSVDTMVTAAQKMLNSSYFSGLTEYGVTAMPTYSAGQSTIDTTTDPNPDQDQSVNHVWQCVQNAITNNPSWAPSSSTSAQSSPIYVQVRYGTTSAWSGSNSYSPSGNTGIPADYPLAVNVVDVDIPTTTDLDGFTLALSHELIERLFTGIGGLYVTAPSQDTNQICDGEPEGNDQYDCRLGGSSGPLVTSYWSVQTSAIIVPDPGGQPTVYLSPVWTGVGTSSAAWTGKFDMTIDGQTNETITIQSAPDDSSEVEVWQSSISKTEPVYTGNWSSLIGRHIYIIPSSNDTINIRNLPAGVSLAIGSNYADTINVSPGTDQATILGWITVFNHLTSYFSTTATLNINDTSDSGGVGRTATFGAGPNGLDQITFSGLGTIFYDYGTTSKPNITITASKFGNTFDIQRADANVTLNTGWYGDTVAVGNSTDGVREIGGDVIIKNANASTNLTIDDSADTTTTPYTVGMSSTIDPFGDYSNYGTVDGLLPNSHLVYYEDFSLSSLTVKTPAVNNTVNVYGTFAPTYLISGGSLAPRIGYDTVNVGPSGGLGFLSGDLYIENPPGTDSVNVNDSADSVTGRQVTLSDFTPPSPAPAPWGDTDTFGRISGLAASGATINYEYRDTSSVTIQTGGGDVVNVFSTGVPTNLIGTMPRDGSLTATRVNVGSGGSLAGITSDLNIENPSWFTDVTVNDGADNTAPTFTLSSLGPDSADFASNIAADSRTDTWGQISGLPAGANINYEYSDTSSLTLAIGAGATVDVLATRLSTTTLLGTGQTTVNLGNQNNVQGLGGDVFIQNQVPGATTVYVNDSSDMTSLPNVSLNDYFDANGLQYMSISNLALGATIYTQNSGVASVTITGGTPSSGGNTYNVDNTTFNTSVTLTAGSGGDTVNILANSGPVIVDPNGGVERVNVGMDGYVGIVDGGITIKPGAVTLTVDDSQDPDPRTLTITSQGLDNGLAPGALQSPWLAYSTLESLTIIGGTPPPVNRAMAPGDTFNVLSVPTTFQRTTLQTGGAKNAVNVQSSNNLYSSWLYIQGNGGNDTVTLGSLAPNLGGNMASISNVDVTNPGGSTALILDDSGDTAPRTPTLTSSSVYDLGTNPIVYPGYTSHTVTINYSPNVGPLTVWAGAGGNTFTVQGTGLATSTILHGGSGGDTANVYGNSSPLALQSFANVNIGQRGLVNNVSGGITTSNDGAVSVDDSNDSIAQSVTITSNTVNGFPGSIPASWLTYSGLHSLTIHAGTPAMNGVPTGAGNTFYVQGTAPMPAGTPTVPGGTILHGGQGQDTFDIGSDPVNLPQSTLDPIQGAITINGQGNSTLNVHDDGNPVTENYTVSPTTIQRSIVVTGVYNYNIATITYYTVGHVNVYVGSAQTGLNQGAVINSVDVVGTLAGTVTDLYGNNAGGQTTFDATPYVDVSGYNAKDQILGAVHFHGSSIGFDTAGLYDYFDHAPQSYTMTAGQIVDAGTITNGQIVPSGFAPVTYDGRLYGAGLTTSAVGGSTVSLSSTGTLVTGALGFGTVVQANAGDTVTVGSQTPALGGTLSQLGTLNLGTVAGINGPATFILDDSGDTQMGKQATFNTDWYAWGVSGLSLGRIYFGAGSNVQVQGGSPAAGRTGSNTYSIQSVPAGISLALNAGTGGDTVNVGSSINTLDPIQGAITINGKGNSTLNIYDSGTTISENYSVSPTSIQRSIIAGGVYNYNTAPINYYQVGNIAVYVGTAQTGLNQGAVINTLDVFGTEPGTTTDLYGNNSGGQTQFAIAPYESAPPQGSGSGTYNASNQLLVAVHYHASSRGLDTVTYYDYLDPAARSYAMTAGQIVATGFAPLTYDGRVYGAVLFTSEVGGSAVNLSSTGPGALLTHVVANTGDVVTVGSQAPALGGSLSQMGEMILQTIGSAQSATFILDDSGDPNAETASYYNDGYAPGFSGLSPSRIYFNVGSGSNVQVRGGTNPANSLTATFPGDFNQNWTVSGFNTSSGFTIPGNFTGSLLAPTLGTAAQPIQQIQIGGSMMAGSKIKVSYLGSLAVGGDLAGIVNGYGNSGSQSQPAIGTVTVGGNFSGTITAPSIGSINQKPASTFSGHALETTPGADFQSLVLGTVTSTAVIQAGAIASATVAGDMAGTMTVSGPLGTLSVGGNLTGTVSATTIGGVSVAQNMTGTVSASQSIGSVTAGGTISGSVTAPVIQQATVNGTASGNDTFILTPSSVVLNGTTILSGTFASVAVHGGAGNDLFQIEGGVVPATITTGSGNNTFQFFTGASITGALTAGAGTNTLDYSQYAGNILVDLILGSATGVGGGIANIQQVKGSQGNDLIVGNADPSMLIGGTGRNILIGGAGQATLDASASKGDNILIGGTTNWDKNITALDAIMAEWDRTDLDFYSRLGDLVGFSFRHNKPPLNVVNGQPILLTPATNRASNNGTVHANAFSDTLIGSGGTDPATGNRVHNWYLFSWKDVIKNFSFFKDWANWVS